MKKIQILISALLLFAIVTSCGGSRHGTQDWNGIYYWRTVLTLDDSERDFLDRHDIKKMYIRFFDVTQDWNSYKDEIVPTATLQLVDTLPADVEVIPTIYITNSTMEDMQLKENEYAEKIVRRVKAMCRRYGIDFKEIQLDCDWTRSTRDYFYKLCREVKDLLEPGQILSSTIRLHQLTQEPPPVDKGVLMVYNTGKLLEMTTENSIFSLKEIAPYLKDNRLANYPLQLDIAYPAFGWSVVFYPFDDDYRFYRLLRKTDFSNFPELKKIGKNIYEAKGTVNLASKGENGEYIYEGYRIRTERPGAKEILKVKDLIEHQMKDKPHSNILYHLDESQLSHFSSNEIDKIYNTL